MRARSVLMNWTASHGHGFIRALDKAQVALEDEAVSADRPSIRKLRATVTKLQRRVDHYKTHMRHYAVARKFVKRIKNHLTPTEVLVFRDFVNMYNEKGHHRPLLFGIVVTFVVTGANMSNLVFVIMRRGVDQLMIDYVDNFASAKTNSAFHCVAFDLLFPFRHESLYFWRSWPTFLALTLHVVGLCSYDAYNRCDGHAAVLKRRAIELSRWVPDPHDYSHAVNTIPSAQLRNISALDYWVQQFSDADAAALVPAFTKPTDIKNMMEFKRVLLRSRLVS